jgi:hypothetical protein
VGTTSPEYKLHVIGDVAATSFVNISTSKSKKDISHIVSTDRNALLASLSSIPVSNYRYIHEDESAPMRLGLIAEESPQEILSQDGKGVDLYKLSTMILVAVQEQQKQIQALQAHAGLAQTNADGTQNNADTFQAAVQFGLITLPGSIEAWDMKGKALANVFAILSSYGTWSIDESGNLIVKKVTAQELCLEDVCIKKEQLKKLLDLLGNNPELLNAEATPEVGPPVIGEPEPSVGTLISELMPAGNVTEPASEPSVVEEPNVGTLTPEHVSASTTTEPASEPQTESQTIE